MLGTGVNICRTIQGGELRALIGAWRVGLGRDHERDQAVDEVVDVLEGARLRVVAVHGQVIAAEGLHDKVGDDAAVEWVPSEIRCKP